MKNANEFEFDDLQGLVRFGYSKLADTCFLLMNITDVEAAKQWLSAAPISTAAENANQTGSALQIAFTAEGLREIGLQEPYIAKFSDEFIAGMAGDESRSRRLGDIDNNAPKNWLWGGKAKQMPHVLLLLYAKAGEIETLRKKVTGKNFSKAFKVLATLPTEDIGDREPFGFVDGISQPRIDWQRQQGADAHDRSSYSNLTAVGEVLLGYPNEYGQYTNRPLIDVREDKYAEILPNAEDEPKLKDLGRNGTYLVWRQLHQDAPGFWQFVDKATGSVAKKREQLAAAMVGRNRDGTPLIPITDDEIPGIPQKDGLNHFTYVDDPAGTKCPFGVHIRRTNPRTGDLPAGGSGFFATVMKLLGFGQRRLNEDLIASTRFHRLLRRGRSYGPRLTPEDAIKAGAPVAERGLQFICLVANIQRQFEFVQNAWVVSSKFAGVQQEQDPLLGHRKPLFEGEATDQFHQPDSARPTEKTCGLPQFITVRGGGYFFMPGLRALIYLAALPSNRSNKAS